MFGRKKENDPIKNYKGSDVDVFEMDRKYYKRKYRIRLLLLILAIILINVFYYVSTLDAEYAINEKDLRIPIFLYHNIVETENDVKLEYMDTSKETFQKQLEGLQKRHYHFISYKDLNDYKQGKKKLHKYSCLLTFDDGYKTIYDNAYPYLKEKNIPFTMFVITDKLDENENKLKNKEGQTEYITWEQAREIQNSKVGLIASHSKDHADFETLSPEQAVENVTQSYEEIEKNLGKQEEKIFTYPYGKFTNEQIDRLKNLGYIENLTDNKINKSKDLKMYALHRCYPLSDSTNKMILKIKYRSWRYN